MVVRRRYGSPRPVFRLTIAHDRDVLLVRPDFYDDERLDEMIRHGPGLVAPRLLHHSVVLGKLLQATFET